MANNRSLADTSAGKELIGEMKRIKAKHKAEIEAIKEELKGASAKNAELSAALQAEQDRRIHELEKILEDERTINQSTKESLEKRIHELEKRPRCLVM